jgi:hypothetical protein
MNMQNSMKWVLVVLSIIYVFLLISCSGEYIYRKDVEQLSKPGALDLPLTGFYSHYRYKLLDRYQFKHQWLRESNCQYSKIESEKYESKDRLTKDRFFDVDDIYEEGNSTWQRDGTRPARNFDRFVRPEYTVQTRSGLKTEKGYNVLCLETWWVTSHSIALFLRKQPLDEMKAGFSKWYPEGVWTTKKINNLTWHVQETSEDKFRPRPINGVGGPFQTWVLPLADTGYTMAIELGASKESLQYPDAHARMQAMFKRLIESVSIEPLANTSVLNDEAPKAPQALPDQSSSQINLINPEISRSVPEASSTTLANDYFEQNRFREQTNQLQIDMQNISNRQMEKMLKDTAPKSRR